MTTFLKNIDSPSEVKKLNKEELNNLAKEVRNVLIDKMSLAGGHSGSNLGIVELTIALHYVFDSPRDKIIFDVSHQCYCHKILTGRKDAYLDSNNFYSVSGYTNPLESEHDIFRLGHTSTSISLALGMAKARDLNKKDENVIAIIGDGSLTGGEALEALNYAGEYDKNLIIVVNDNEQCIAENHGGLYKNLKELRDSKGNCINNFFKVMGLDYIYCDDGNDANKLIEVFNQVKDIKHPIVVHIHTIKGKGLSFAEIDRESWHSVGPFNIQDGSKKEEEVGIVFDCLKNLLDNNPHAIVINAAMPSRIGFTKKVREQYIQKGQFLDVGVAEENGVAICSGAAKGGAISVFATYAPFFQRTYDQMSHDVCLNDSPAVFLMLKSGVYGMNSNTHISLCDIQLFAHIPNFIYFTPSCNEELIKMFEYATTQREHPIGIRISDNLKWSNMEDQTDYKLFKNKVVIKGSKVAIFAVSTLVVLAKEVAYKVKEDLNQEITIINPLFVNDLDIDLLDSLKENHHLIITIEDGELQGGYGQTIASYYGNSNLKVINLGISKEFHTNFKPENLLKENGISLENLVNIIKNNI